jgi:hypothetical protein
MRLVLAAPQLHGEPDDSTFIPQFSASGARENFLQKLRNHRE